MGGLADPVPPAFRNLPGFTVEQDWNAWFVRCRCRAIWGYRKAEDPTSLGVRFMLLMHARGHEQPAGPEAA